MSLSRAQPCRPDFLLLGPISSGFHHFPVVLKTKPELMAFGHMSNPNCNTARDIYLVLASHLHCPHPLLAVLPPVLAFPVCSSPHLKAHGVRKDFSDVPSSLKALPRTRGTALRGSGRIYGLTGGWGPTAHLRAPATDKAHAGEKGGGMTLQAGISVNGENGGGKENKPRSWESG